MQFNKQRCKIFCISWLIFFFGGTLQKSHGQETLLFQGLSSTFICVLKPLFHLIVSLEGLSTYFRSSTSYHKLRSKWSRTCSTQMIYKHVYILNKRKDCPQYDTLCKIVKTNPLRAHAYLSEHQTSNHKNVNPPISGATYYVMASRPAQNTSSTEDFVKGKVLAGVGLYKGSIVNFIIMA